MTENNGTVDTSINTGTVPPEGTEVETTETIEEVRAKLAKAEELAGNYKTRAEKAEKAGKQPKMETVVDPTTTESDMSQSDLLAVVKAGVSEDDIDEVRDYAALKKISIKDALKSPFMQQVLSDKNEQRKTAAAAHTGAARRSTATVSDEDIVNAASTGKLPDDVDKLAQARIAMMKKGR